VHDEAGSGAVLVGASVGATVGATLDVVVGCAIVESIVGSEVGADVPLSPHAPSTTVMAITTVTAPLEPVRLDMPSTIRLLPGGPEESKGPPRISPGGRKQARMGTSR
jgi:hypothetical protein